MSWATGAFELCAPGMVNRVELVAMIGVTIGRTIEAGESPFDEWAQATQIPDGLRENLRVMYQDYDQYGFPGGNAIVLRAILHRTIASLSPFFAQHYQLVWLELPPLHKQNIDDE